MASSFNEIEYLVPKIFVLLGDLVPIPRGAEGFDRLGYFESLFLHSLGHSFAHF